MAELSPMMKQYKEIKENYKHCLLFFRLGDFYELFFEDAEIASSQLGLTLTGKQCGLPEKAPMCGVPFHSVNNYLSELVEFGYKVAICDQVGNPKESKGIVKREVVKVVSSGTITNSNNLKEWKNNYIASVFASKNEKDGIGFACCDITTGEYITCVFQKLETLIDELAKYDPAQVLINLETKEENSIKLKIQKIFNVNMDILEEFYFEHSQAYTRLCTHFKVMNLTSYEIEDEKLAVSASGALLYYIYETQKTSLVHIRDLKLYKFDKFMSLDISSRRNLELTESMKDREKKGSLVEVLDKTSTAIGSRCIRKWVEQPLLDLDVINNRANCIEVFYNNIIIRENLKEKFKSIYDLERLTSKLIYKNATPRDLISLKNSFNVLPDIDKILKSCNSKHLNSFIDNFDNLSDVCEIISNSIVDDPPASVRDEGIIKNGYDEELDTYYLAKKDGSTWLMEFESREREKTGIRNLKIKYNKIFGYNIEVTNSNKDLVPEYYVRRQTLANCERYSTDELYDIAEKILNSEEKISELETRLFNEVCEKIIEHSTRIQFMANIIANLDAIVSLAQVASLNKYVKPIVDNSDIIDIKNGRHPVVENSNKSGIFVPNDLYLDANDIRLGIITGPNMAGKSTYMRQNALIVLMAQIGSFVPADFARIGIVDRIFTRVGASDDLATGQSTFMVEMTEVAGILRNATNKSFLILDEIGRGTSTYDGLSIAWSVLEYISIKGIIGARGLFATHYHELTMLEGMTDGIRNFCVDVAEDGEDIVFLRRIVQGGAKESYGINVAKLAGLPGEVVDRSKQVLKELGGMDKEKINRIANNIKNPILYNTLREVKMNTTKSVKLREDCTDEKAEQ